MFGSLSRLAALFCFLPWFGNSPRFAEDVKLREEVVRLVEKANQVSLSGVMPTYEHAVTFTVHYPDGAKVSKFPPRRQGEG